MRVPGLPLSTQGSPPPLSDTHGSALHTRSPLTMDNQGPASAGSTQHPTVSGPELLDVHNKPQLLSPARPPLLSRPHPEPMASLTVRQRLRRRLAAGRQPATRSTLPTPSACGLPTTSLRRTDYTRRLSSEGLLQAGMFSPPARRPPPVTVLDYAVPLEHTGQPATVHSPEVGKLLKHRHPPSPPGAGHNPTPHSVEPTPGHSPCVLLSAERPQSCPHAQDPLPAHRGPAQGPSPLPAGPAPAVLPLPTSGPRSMPTAATQLLLAPDTIGIIHQATSPPPTGCLPPPQHNQASEHNDLSHALLTEDMPHKLGSVHLSDSWVTHQPAHGSQVAVFTPSDFPHKVKPASDAAVLQRMAAVDEASALLQHLKHGTVPASMSANPQQLMDSVLQRLPDPDNFQAGGWTPYAEVWDYTLAMLNSQTRQTKQVLSSIRHGIQWPLVAPASQTLMPDHRQKMARLSTMLTRQLGAQAAAEALTTASPKRVEFPNHMSVKHYPDFVTTTVQDMLRANAIMRLPPGQVPLIVNPIGVVDTKAPKLRLILDPAYPNQLFRYRSLKYEQLQDMCSYLNPGDYATTTDEKSGYYHQALHPSMWTLLGFQWQGAYYVFTHMAFGVGPACKAYTDLKQQLFRLVRELGNVRMTFLIDDQCNVAPTRLAAMLQASAILLLQWALNFTLSIPKCQLTPTPQPHFLGMVVDIPNMRFMLPDKKIQEFQALTAALAGSTATTKRLLARAAGKLVSFAPAIGLAPLYARQLFLIMKGRAAWDSLYPTPPAAVEALQWVASHLALWNGHRWASARSTLVVAGDYSSVMGYGAFTPNHELADPIVLTLTTQELAAIAANRFSSTYGEIKCVLHTLSVLIRHHPHLVCGRRLQYQGDNSAAMHVLSTMAGNAANFPLVRQVWEAAKAADIELSFEWWPRETPTQVLADSLSKLTDNSQWLLNQSIYDSFVTANAHVQRAGGITVDLFADDLSAKVPRFMSRHWCPGTEGINAMSKGSWATHPVTGARELSYINGDFSRMGDILAKVIADKADCVIVYPSWPRYWQVLWSKIPVRQLATLPRFPALCQPGPRVDTSKARGLPPRYKLLMAVVMWSPNT